MPHAIRPYRPADLDGVVEAWETAARAAYPFLDEAFFDAERDAVRGVHMEVADVLVCVDAGRVLGFVALLGDVVGGLFVHRDAQGQGVGRALLDHVAARGRRLELEVFTRNRQGRRFYDRYGWQDSGRRTVHAPTGEAQMVLVLEPRGVGDHTDATTP